MWKRNGARQSIGITAFFLGAPWLLWIVFSGHRFFILLFGLSLSLWIPAAGYFYRAAKEAFSDSPAILLWEKPVDFFKSGLDALRLAAGVFSLSILSFVFSFLMIPGQHFFWITFWAFVSLMAALFSIVILPVAIFRMIESGDFLWSLRLGEIIDDIAAMKIDYAETLLSALVLFLIGEAALLIIGAILSLTPIGPFAGGSLTVLASGFLLSSIGLVVLQEIGALYLSLPYSAPKAR